MTLVTSPYTLLGQIDQVFNIGWLVTQVRCQFIRSSVCRHFGLDTDAREPFSGLRMLDVGCGGGLLCEPLARMGAEVMGVDAVAHSIQVASAHAQRYNTSWTWFPVLFPMPV